MDEIEEIIDFIIQYPPYSFKSRETLEEIIRKHLEYNTCLVIKAKKDIVAVARWNIKDDTAYILDVIIKDGFRNTKFLKYLVFKGWEKFPFVKYIQFKRRKYPTKDLKTYSIERLGGFQWANQR